MLILTKDEEHQALINWIGIGLNRPYKDLFVHYFQENKKTTQAGINLGIPMVFMAWPNGTHHGLWIEVQRTGKAYKSPTFEQSRWLKTMNNYGYDTFVAKGWTQARDYIQKYINVSKTGLLPSV